VIATFAAGYIALRVYQKQKNDEKRNAANVIVLEIEGAEEGLRKVSVDRPFTGNDEADTVLMKTTSWDKYKHLFVADFLQDRNEWNKIADFYTQCGEYDTAVVGQNEMTDFNTQQMIANQQQVLAKYAEEYSIQLSNAKTEKEKTKFGNEYIARRTQFIGDYTGGVEGHIAQINLYIPVRFSNNAG